MSKKCKMSLNFGHFTSTKLPKIPYVWIFFGLFWLEKNHFFLNRSWMLVMSAISICQNFYKVPIRNMQNIREFCKTCEQILMHQWYGVWKHVFTLNLLWKLNNNSKFIRPNSNRLPSAWFPEDCSMLIQVL